jgi:hypothetical protein
MLAFGHGEARLAVAGVTGRPRGHGGHGGDDNSPTGDHGRDRAGGRRSPQARTVSEAEDFTASAFQRGRPTAGGEPTGTAAPVDVTHATDPDEARVMDVYHKLGAEPPEIDIAANDADYSGLGAHTEQRHGPTVPLRRDPDPQSGNRTIEGRIYGDPPWPHAQNWSYRWTDPGTMNRTINAYLRDNWEGIRSDLALDGEHEGKIIAANAVGQGYYNPGMHGTGPRASTFGVTSMAKVQIKLVPGSDPPIPFIVTTFPSGT